jgi:hypothetical protein
MQATTAQLKEAFATQATARHIEAAAGPYTSFGAARLYVVIADKDDRKAVKKAGIKLIAAYGVTESPCAYYVGYQNFSGQVPGRALAIQESLKALGVSCYVDGQQD